MDSSELDQTKLDQIAEEFSASIRRGEQPTIDDYVAKYPDPSGMLRDLLASIEMIEGLKPQSTNSGAANHESPGIERLDDYNIVREIGRGGMGIVFEAIHQSLQRRVAVKVLATGLLGDTKHLARFRREARAAARLRHTNIVGVFGVGTADNHHYYVMDFIDGMSLREWLVALTGKQGLAMPTIDEVIDRTAGELDNLESEKELVSRSELAGPLPDRIDTPAYFRWVAHIGASVADAIQYAHDQGVLHRDIKPANLLVDRRGEVWIADFGLAKLTEQQAVTKSGDVVGTPQYMPPESFGGNYDVRSEVYSLGLTLYELLALRPAIEGRNTAEVIRKASLGVSVSPRKANPLVPRDLETIVLKSLAIDPRSRYVSAGELRDDLERFLSDRPISARRTGLIERSVRWSRREPTTALLTFSTFALLLALAVVSAVGFFRTSSALNVADGAKRSAVALLEQRTAALAAAEGQRIRAEKNLQVALAAFDRTMKNVIDRGIEADAEFLGEVTDTTSANVTSEDAALLQSLLEFFDELAANNSADLLAESAVAARRAGEIYLRLGQLANADQAFSDALKRYEQLEAKLGEGEKLDSALARAEIMNDLAVITSLRGQLGRAYEMFHQAVALLENDDSVMRTAAGQFAYARAHRLFASLGARTGLDVVTSPPRVGEGRPTRGPMNLMLRIRTDDERAAIDKAIEVLEQLARESDTDVRYRAELARAYRDKAKVASRAKRKGESESAVRQSIELFEKLLQENQDSDAIQYELAMTLTSTEAFTFNQIVRATRANELASTLLSTAPDLPRYQSLKAHTLETLASHQQRVNRFEAAEENLFEALRIYNSLANDSPELRLYETRRAQTLESIADVKLRQGDTEAATEFLQRGIRSLQFRSRAAEFSPIARMQIQRMRQKINRINNEPEVQ